MPDPDCDKWTKVKDRLFKTDGTMDMTDWQKIHMAMKAHEEHCHLCKVWNEKNNRPPDEVPGPF